SENCPTGDPRPWGLAPSWTTRSLACLGSRYGGSGAGTMLRVPGGRGSPSRCHLAQEERWQSAAEERTLYAASGFSPEAPWRGATGRRFRRGPSRGWQSFAY
ncbi:Hypothetical predicted protein, partial [Podarcis lilfordi]